MAVVVVMAMVVHMLHNGCHSWYISLPKSACALLSLHCTLLLVLFLTFVALLCFCSSLPSLFSSTNGHIGLCCLPLLADFLAFVAFMYLCSS